MAEFTLTVSSDSFTGTNAVDHFVGRAVPGFTTGQTGGSDTLDGGSGNDHFYLDSLSSGTIIGGAGTDVIHAYGSIGFSVTLSGLEVLDLATEDNLDLVGIAASQLNGFKSLTGHVFADNRIALELGVNADVDFRVKVGTAATFGVDAHITGIIANGSGSYTIKGSNQSDRFVNETANNASGIYDGGAGNDVFIADNSGGLDILRGGTGADLFDLDGTSFGLGGVMVASIDGGAGIDTIEATNTSLVDIGLANIDVLTGTNISLTSAQLALFDRFEDVATPYLFLSGVGGSHNFTGRTPSGISLDCSQATSGGNYIFAASDDRWIGSQLHGETVDGGLGNDTFAVTLDDRATSNDELNGGGGNDTFIVTSNLAASAGLQSDAARSTILTIKGGAGINILEVRDASLLKMDLETLQWLNVFGGRLVIGEIKDFALFTSIFLPSEQNTARIDEVQRLKLEIAGAGGTLDFTNRAQTLPVDVGLEIDGNALSSAFTVTGSTRGDKISTTNFDDVLAGGLGKDELFGGIGNDAYTLGAEASGIDQVEDSGGIADRITSTITRSLAHAQFTEIENLTLLGGSAAINGTGNGLVNIITGNNGSNVLSGGSDKLIDTLRGGLGADTYMLANGKDHVKDTGGIDTATSTISRNLSAAEYAEIENLQLLGGAAAINGAGNVGGNTITGNDGGNKLAGADGNDVLIGGLGNDTLTGGTGVDALTGGDGNDVYDFNSTAESGLANGARDIIADFVQGEDKIDFVTIDAKAGTGNEDFVFIGSAAFTAAGQARSFQLGGNTFVELNTSGTSGAEMQVRLNGLYALTEDDFA